MTWAELMQMWIGLSGWAFGLWLLYRQRRHNLKIIAACNDLLQTLEKQRERLAELKAEYRSLIRSNKQ